jgi:hypothetical protein
MARWQIFGALIAASVLASWRYLDTMAVGTGEIRRSPDGRYTASVMDYSGRSFFTNAPRRWFEIKVEGPGTTVALVSTPFPGPYFGSRSSHRVVLWEADSTAVRFVFPTATLRFSTSQ